MHSPPSLPMLGSEVRLCLVAPDGRRFQVCEDSPSRALGRILHHLNNGYDLSDGPDRPFFQAIELGWTVEIKRIA